MSQLTSERLQKDCEIDRNVKVLWIDGHQSVPNQTPQTPTNCEKLGELEGLMGRSTPERFQEDSRKTAESLNTYWSRG